tara:strand:- start:571 stop:1794 length:1224 start_codon:yes stop_codon:yes gene_type:complete
MQIIESITNKNNFIDSQSALQKICHNKLKVTPLPNKKSEIWRTTSRPKLESFLDFTFSNDFHYPIFPEHLESQDTLRIIIGENKKVNIKKKNYVIKTIEEKELINLIKQKLTNCDTTQNWSNLLNHYLTNKSNILGLNISGNDIPDIEIISNSKTNLFNSKTLVINIERNTKVNITQINLGDENCALSESSYLYVGKNSSVHHGIVSFGKKKSYIINSLNVFQEKNSEYNLGSLQFRFNFARLELDIEQIEGNAKTNIKGMQITSDNEQISTYAKIKFNGPNGYLNQLNKSLARDRSHSVFEGLIIVPQIAQKTDASQLSRNLLLSDYAKIDTKPQLEIIADDVKCMHGATISQLNENELFYMRSRGLTLEQASKLQLRSYYQEIISFLPISKERWDLLSLLLKNQK